MKQQRIDSLENQEFLTESVSTLYPITRPINPINPSATEKLAFVQLGKRVRRGRAASITSTYDPLCITSTIGASTTATIDITGNASIIPTQGAKRRRRYYLAVILR